MAEPAWKQAQDDRCQDRLRRDQLRDTRTSRPRKANAMDSFLIRGGSRLKGSVEISGSKNSSLPILAACLMAQGKTTLKGVPRLSDIESMTALITQLELGPTVVIGDEDTGVTNVFFSTGCTIQDLVAIEEANARNHGGFVSGIAHLSNALRDAGVISHRDKARLQTAAAHRK